MPFVSKFIFFNTVPASNHNFSTVYPPYLHHHLNLLLGIGASLFIEKVFLWPVSIKEYTVILAFTVCSIIGIFYGWHPARKASRLDPIEAIRYE